ncbi:hypothetical protein D3C87_823310 [compost metagenome]
MGKIIDRERRRQHALEEKDTARRSREADVALMQSLHAAYGGNSSVAGPIMFIAVIIGFLVWVLYAVFWR